MFYSEQSRTSCFYGLRLIAILGIVVLHTGNEILGGGAALCSFFFIVSGFLYVNNDFSFKNYIKYLKKKVFKIFPIYWFCLILYLLFQFLRGHFYIDYDIIPHIFLVQAWFPWGKEMAYLGMAWFLSSLLFCYLFSPLVSLLLKKYKYLSLFAALTIICSIFLYDCWHSPWMTYISPVYRISEYALAMWVRKYLCYKEVRKPAVPILGILWVFIWVGVLHFADNQIVYITANILIVWILYNYSYPAVDMLLGNKPMRMMASYIFFIYLTHNVIGFHIAWFFIGNNTFLVVIISILCGISIGIVYKYVSMLLGEIRKKEYVPKVTSIV